MPDPESPAIMHARLLLKKLDKNFYKKRPGKPRKQKNKKLRRRRNKKKRAKRQKIRRKLGKVGTSIGYLTEERVRRLLQILKDKGFISEFQKSERNDKNDRVGKDFFGKLSPEYGGINFSIDAKTSAKSIKPSHRLRKNVLIFIPLVSATDEEEAKRLFEEIRKFFNKQSP